MEALFSLFDWCPGSLGLLLGGGLALFILYGVFKLIVAVVRVILDLIPGW